MNESASVGLSEAAKRKRAAYYRDWRRRNPGKASEYQRRYWRKKAEESASHETSDEGKTVRESD